MLRLLCIVIGYAFGLFQTGFLVGKLNHVDIRQKGSGNSGTTNTLRVLGWKAGLITFAGDVLKCVIAVVLIRLIFRQNEICPLLELYTAAGVTLGHNFPFYMKFKGGKGIAVMAGLVLALSLKLVPIPLLAFIIIVALTRFVSVGSLVAYVMFFCESILYGEMGGLALSTNQRIEYYAVIFLLMALAWFRHIPNIKRLLDGTENRFGSKTKKEE